MAGGRRWSTTGDPTHDAPRAGRRAGLLMRTGIARSLAALVVGPALAACAGDSTAVAYTGATVWDGTGAPAVTDATIVVDSGRIVAIGADVRPPRGAATVALDGKYVIPGLIESHGHVTG